MTVEQVIERLKDLPPKSRVYVVGVTWWSEVRTVTGNFCSPYDVAPYIPLKFCSEEPDVEKTEVVVKISGF